MEERKVVDNFMYYIFNVWCEEEAIKLYGNNLGKHIYEKWVCCRMARGDQLEWYANLDETCREKLVGRANDYYSNK